jgi:hypothetical protein
MIFPLVRDGYEDPDFLDQETPSERVALPEKEKGILSHFFVLQKRKLRLRESSD